MNNLTNVITLPININKNKIKFELINERGDYEGILEIMNNTIFCYGIKKEPIQFNTNDELLKFLNGHKLCCNKILEGRGYWDKY